jgi:hypothetical protein
MALATPVTALRAQSILEVEPNDDAQSATSAHLGDTVSGTINPDDVDYFAVALDAGAELEVIAAQVPFCRDFSILDPSGNRLAFADCIEGIDTLRVTVPTAGRYLIRVTQFDDAPGVRPSHAYSLYIGAGSAPSEISSVVNALLTGDLTTLDASLVQTLDQQGNANGVLDVGDLRAYLRAHGQLAPSKN